MSEKVSPEIEALLKEDRSFVPSQEFWNNALINEVESALIDDPKVADGQE